MNGYNFTERVRKVLAMAREEAARLHHEYLGTEHILLGLVREGDGVAAVVLQNLGVADDLERRIEEKVKQGKPGQTTGPDLPYSSRAKKAIELAMAEARALNHVYVGTEHLLLGLIREKRGVGAQVLDSVGITIDAARAEVLRILGTEVPVAPGRTSGVSHHAMPGAAMSRTGTRMMGYAQLPAGTAWMAASILEALMHEPGIADVFAAQEIDAGKLIAALQASAFRSPPGDAPGSSAGQSPPAA
jgi:ATP-dependent Clp protease ATP-binding subunit ClpC